MNTELDGAYKQSNYKVYVSQAIFILCAPGEMPCFSSVSALISSPHKTWKYE
jgi:hypothetical protein